MTDNYNISDKKLIKSTKKFLNLFVNNKQKASSIAKSIIIESGFSELFADELIQRIRNGD